VWCAIIRYTYLLDGGHERFQHTFIAILICPTVRNVRIVAPYCGFVTGDGTLYSAKDGENITFQDGTISRLCSCEVPADPTAPPIRSCEVIPSDLGCNMLDLNGNPVFIQNGESLGNLIVGACGPASQWPSYCYVPPGSSGGNDFLIEYPYCVFSDTNSRVDVCAKNVSTVDYVDQNGTSLSCYCNYTLASGSNPNCKRVPQAALTTAPPVSAPNATQAPVPPTTKKNKSGAAPRRSMGVASVAMYLFATIYLFSVLFEA